MNARDEQRSAHGAAEGGLGQRFVAACIRQRVTVVGVLGVLTLLMAWLGSQVQLKTVFGDLLPSQHPYVQVHEKFKQTFGSSNLVTVMLRVKDGESGDLFTTARLARLKKATEALQRVPAVNEFQVISLAARKLKEVRASTEGIDIAPLMFPQVPDTPQALDRLREAVLRNPLVYGSYVSADLRSALITLDFYEAELDYGRAYEGIYRVMAEAEQDGLVAHAVGEPLLYGWVQHYVPETLRIFLLTLSALIALLFVTARTLRGTLLPLLAGVVSSIWAFGAARLLGFHLDPLVIVVAFLITARAVSHSVQLVTNFDDRIAAGVADSRAAAEASMQALLKPGMLGVVADAGCMCVVLLAKIPLLQKVALIGTVWVSTIAVSAVVLTPVLLSWIQRPQGHAHRLDLTPAMNRLLRACANLALSRHRFTVVAVTALVFVASGLYAFRLQVGDANPGSPILWPQSVYNRDAVEINRTFAGADRMFVVASVDATDGLKQPEALQSLADFQRFMEAQPEVGATVSLADIVPSMKRTLREGNPRYEEFGSSQGENGEILYLFTSGTDPGDIDRFVDPAYRNASVTLLFRDHTGPTIRTAVARVQEFVAAHPESPVKFQLAGGLVGVLAAVNEVILMHQIESIALALLVLVICCAVAYGSLQAGLFFMVPVLLSNTLTFSFMAWQGIGMNINTLPIAALGIGLGVDYAFYIVDGIKEELQRGRALDAAVRASLLSAGRGVLVTAATLVTSVVLWTFSSIRFQAEMGLLMALWLAVSAASSLLLMPALVVMLQPRFVMAPSGRPAPQAGAAAVAESA